jgi:hypothetical protein
MVNTDPEGREDMSTEQLPRAIVALKVAQESAKTIFTVESQDEVRAIVNKALAAPHPPLVTFTRWLARGVETFTTRPDNVATVEDNR